MTAGVASLAVKDLLRGTRRHGKVLAALPHAIYLEFADAVPEPRVIAVSPPDAIRLPNAIITGSWETCPPGHPASAAECWAGGSRVMACDLDIRVVRWWDPSPVFGPLSRAIRGNAGRSLPRTGDDRVRQPDRVRRRDGDHPRLGHGIGEIQVDRVRQGRQDLTVTAGAAQQVPGRQAGHPGGHRGVGTRRGSSHVPHSTPGRRPQPPGLK